jgi:Phosphoserine phosphatase RsbU, N-terminal domain/GAF domain
MRVDVSSGPGSFQAAYTSALSGYVDTPTETALRVAYELGREAISRELSVLDLAVTHQQALSSVLAERSGMAELQQVTVAAGDFFLESLSIFEMVQRGLKEARQAFLHERRHTEISRQLSNFLADASLALEASDSLAEMLRLVAEQARELIRADCCVATVSVDGHRRTTEAVFDAEGDRRWRPFVRWLDLAAVQALVRSSGGSMRTDAGEVATLPLFVVGAIHPPIHGWLAAAMTTLDGSELGVLQLYNNQPAAFSAEDQAALVYLAQMASAAIERAGQYQKPAS